MSKAVKSMRADELGALGLLRAVSAVSLALLASSWCWCARAQNVTLAWDQNSETNLSNYTLKYGTASGNYTAQISVATNTTTATANNLTPGLTYYFIVTARNVAGLESTPSTEVSYLVPRTTPDTAPIANAASLTTPEDSPKTITLTGSDADGDPLTYTVVGAPAHGSLAGSAPNLTYTPAVNYAGADSFTFRVNDGFTNSATATISITVSAVNDAPTLNALANVTLTTNGTPQTVALSGIGSGAPNENQTLTVTATSSNPGLVPSPAVTYSSPNATGSLTLNPVAGLSGSAIITVTVNDGAAQNNIASRTFTVTVGTLPAVTLFFEAESGTVTAPMGIVSDSNASNGQAVRSTSAEAGTVVFSFNVSQAGTYVVWCHTLCIDAGTDSFYVSVDGGTEDIYDPALNSQSPDWRWSRLKGRVMGDPWAFALGAGNHTLTFRSREAYTGLDSLYLTSDPNFVPGGAPNRAPTLDAISNLNLNEDAPQQTINLAGITDGATNEDQTLTITAASSNPGLIPNPVVNYSNPNTTGSLSFTPVANANGSATITVTVNDGQSVSNLTTRTFVVTVNPVNDPPTLNALGSLTLAEDAGPQTVSLAGISSGAANESQTLTVTAISSLTSLVPNPTVTYTSPSATGTLTFTPAANASGTATITVTVNDGQAANNTVARTFTVTVNPVNDPPTLDAIANRTINEGAGSQSVSLTGIGSGAANEAQTLTLTASSSNPGLIPNPTVNYASPNGTGTLTFTPAGAASGTATISVTVNDGQSANNTLTRTFTVTVNPVNDPPTLDAIANQTINEDAGTQTVNLTGIGSGAANEVQALTVSASSSNPGLIPSPTVNYTSPNATGTLTFTPAANATGTATITVTVNDGQAANNTLSRTFTVTVSPVNDPPTLDAIANRTINEGAGSQSVSLTGIGSGAANEAQTLTLTASSSNPALIPNPTVNYTSPNGTGTLTFTPAADASGTATITVTVNDGQVANNTLSRSFTVTVNPVNDAPTLDAIANRTISEDAGSQTVNLTGIGSGAANEVQPLTLSAASSNPGLIPNPTISYISPNATGTLTFTPAPNANGTATITVTVNDGQAANNTLSRAFTVTVSAVNDAPTLDPLGNVTVAEDAATQTIPLTGIGSGAPNEAQALTVTANSSAPGLIPNPTVSYTSPGATGTISFKPVANGTGTATLTVTVNDGQAQNNTVSRSFVVTVNGQNDAPTLSHVANQTVAEGNSTPALPFTVGDVETPAANLGVTGSSANQTLVPNANIVFGGSGASRTVTVTPAPGQSGSVLITLQVSDGTGGITTDSFTLAVTSVNQPPTLDPIASLTIDEDAGGQTVALTGITSGSVTESQPLVVTASSSNPGLIPTPSVAYSSPNTSGSLTFAPTANNSGSATISVVVNDGQSQNGTITRSFTVTVSPQNDPPTLSSIPDQTIAQNTATALLPFTAGDVETAAGSLILGANSSNPTLVPLSGLALGGSGANRTIKVTPAANQFGQAIITVTVSDGSGGIANSSFLLTVTTVNLPPTLDPFIDLVLAEDAPLQTVALSGISSGSVAENQPLAVTAVSSNPGLIPNPRVNYSSPNATGSLSFTPAANASGNAVITVTVNDGQSQNNSISRSFTVTVNSVNDAPTLNPLANVTLPANTPSQTVALSGISSGAADESQTLTVTAVSSNPSLVPNPAVNYFSPNSTGSLNLYPASAGSGTATITVTVDDGQGQNHTVVRVFTVTVSGANQPPTITDLPDLSIPMNGVASPLNFVIGDAETPAANLRVVATSSNPTLVWTNNIVLSGSGSNRVASIMASSGQSGSAVITFTVYDADGNSAADSFVLSVVPPNLPPTLDPLPSLTVSEDAGPQIVHLTGISPGSAAENQTVIITAVSSTPGVIPHPTVNYQNPDSVGTLVFQPAPNVSGSATITVTVNDGQSRDNLLTRTFGVLVTAQNDPPTISSIPNQVVARNTSTPVLPFIVGDIETPTASLGISASSSDNTLLPAANIILGGSGANRTIQVTPGFNQSGTATITIYVNDGVLTAGSSFDVTVGTGNTAPTIRILGGVLVDSTPTFSTDSYTAITNVGLLVADQESRPEDLVLSAISYNQTVLPTTNILFGGYGSNRTVTFRPVPGKSGTVTVSLGVSDGAAITRTLCTVNVSLGTAPKAKLNVRKKGSGTVQPALDGQDLTIGATYTLTAIPAPNEVFVGWSGSVTSSSPTVSFVMTTNLELICGFTNSPYLAMKGSYNGLFYEAAEVRQASSGGFTLTTTERGTFTAKLKLGATVYPMAGKVNLGCRATNVIVRKTASPLRVELDFSHANQVVGRVTDGAWEAPLIGDRAVFNSKTNPAPYAGTYTLLLPGQPDPELGPEGDSFASLKIDANGLATLAGTLADGTKVTQKVPVAQGGQWPLYVSLYAGSGSALSWLQASNRLSDDVNGLLSWIKQGSSGSKFYAGGFTNECLALGSRFVPAVPPAGALALTQADIRFSGGDLANPFSNALSFDGGKVTNLGANKLALKINAANGLVTGSVIDPASQKTLKFSGVVFQKQNVGSGFLLGTSRSARFVIAE